MRIVDVALVNLMASSKQNDTTIWINLDAISTFNVVPDSEHLRVVMQNGESYAVRLKPERLKDLCNGQ